MKKFIFASLRGKDFEIEGNTVDEAYENLWQREKNNGTLWRLDDAHRNKHAVEKQGFSYFGHVAYKEVK